MSLSKQRQKALKNLKATAEDLWVDQQAIVDRANAVLREARTQAGHLTDEEVRPRVQSVVDTVVPAVHKNLAAVRVAGETARDRFTSDVIPALAGTVGSAASVLQMSRNPEFVQAAGKTVAKAGKGLQKKSGRSAGANVGIAVVVSLGVVTMVGLGYALWQTFRADDELWIADEDPEPVGNPEA
jgi:hypothetical protein